MVETLLIGQRILIRIAKKKSRFYDEAATVSNEETVSAEVASELAALRDWVR